MSEEWVLCAGMMINLSQVPSIGFGRLIWTPSKSEKKEGGVTETRTYFRVCGIIFREDLGPKVYEKIHKYAIAHGWNGEFRCEKKVHHYSWKYNTEYAPPGSLEKMGHFPINR